MNIYLISQNYNNNYDTYDSAVVVARTEDDARKISPSPDYEWSDEFGCFLYTRYLNEKKPKVFYEWVDDLSKITVQLIGTTETYKSGEVILTSFNAG